MRSFTLWAIPLIALAGMFGCTKTQSPLAIAGTDVVSSPQDETAVRATVAEFAKNWNDHDVKAMCELVAEDVLWIVSNGNVWRGKEQVCQAYEQINQHLAANASMHPWSLELMEVRFLAPQLAVATARMRSGQDGQAFHSRNSFVMAGSGGAWKIVHFHSTTILPIIVKNDRPDFGLPR
jgi:uncharacterized protein (TIGR02246 family)